MAILEILFAYETKNYLHQTGCRILASGAYELYNVLAQDGTPIWDTYPAFSPAQLKEIQARLKIIHFSDHASSAKVASPDNTSATITVGSRTLTVNQWPDEAPGDIKELLDIIARFRQELSK